jgi:hypothetical protein
MQTYSKICLSFIYVISHFYVYPRNEYFEKARAVISTLVENKNVESKNEGGVTIRNEKFTGLSYYESPVIVFTTRLS